jgi:putative transposase
MVNFKGAHFPKAIIRTCGRWSVANPLRDRHVEELVQERGVSVDHATINRSVLKYSPQLEAVFHRRKRPVWISWRMDETYRYSAENSEALFIRGGDRQFMSYCWRKRGIRVN